MNSVDYSDKKTGFIVLYTTDKTEGRSYDFPGQCCEIEATAKRLGKGGYVQGCDCPIEKVDLYRINNRWYGPVRVIQPSNEDERSQKIIEAKRKARERLIGAGFSEEDIRLANL